MRATLASLVLAAVAATTLSTMAAAADLVSVDERLFARRDDCANLSEDRMYLSTRVGSDVDGCTLTFGAFNEAFTAAGIPLTYSYPQDGAETYMLDTDGVLEGAVTIGGAYGLPAVGLQTVDISITASYDTFVTAVLYEDTVELVASTGSTFVVDFSAEIDDALAGKEVSGMLLEVTPRGVTTGGPVIQSGATYFTFPHLVDPDEG